MSDENNEDQETYDDEKPTPWHVSLERITQSICIVLAIGVVSFFIYRCSTSSHQVGIECVKAGGNWDSRTDGCERNGGREP